jgi:hypothetical protein
VPIYLQKRLKVSWVHSDMKPTPTSIFYSRSRVKVLWKGGACSDYNMLNPVRWDAVPSGGNGLYHSIWCVRQTPFPLTFPTLVPHHQVDQENPQVEPTDDPLVQPRKSTGIRDQNQLGNSKVVMCYICTKKAYSTQALSLFTAPVPTPLSNPWLGKPSCTRNVLKKYSKCIQI